MSKDAPGENAQTAVAGGRAMPTILVVDDEPGIVEPLAKIFEKEGYQEPATAFEESRRGAYNPTYLYYTLGKLQIYKLREDYKKMKGADYKLETFHNEFVKQGGIPIKLIRKILLPGDTGTTL